MTSYRQFLSLIKSELKQIFVIHQNLVIFYNQQFWQLLYTLNKSLSMGCTQINNRSNDHEDIDLPQIFFVIGGPGSGKGTQCNYLVQQYKFKHLSTGDLLRQQKEKGGKLAQELNKIMNQGKLVTSDLVVRLIKSALVKYGNRKYLIDGFPRNKQNWEEFQKILKHIVVIRGIIFFDCSKAVMMQRIMNRAKTSGRSDDNQQTILKRLETFEQQSFPIIQQFKLKGACIELSAQDPPQKVYENLKKKLEQIEVFPQPLVEAYFLIGGPGSGKGTQCAKLVEKYGFKHISTGDLIRNQVKMGSPKGAELQKLMNEGKMVSSEFLVSLMKQQFQRNNYSGRYLIDGFPRNQLNIEVWNQNMNKTADVKAVLYFHCDHDQLKKRLIQRGKSSGRADDKQETIVKRLKVFQQQTKPLVDYYDGVGKLHKLDSNKTIDQVFKDLQFYLKTRRIQPKQVRRNMKTIIVLGGPGSGKGTQCEKLIQHFGFKHISTGDLIRKQLKGNSLFAQQLKAKVDAGKMIESKFMVKLIRRAFAKQGYSGTFLLDGFPRNQQNIEKWKEQFGIQIRFNNLINIECSAQELQARLINRGKSSGRSDDNPDTIKKRIQTFKNETDPLLKKLASVVDFTITVNSQKSVDQVYNDLEAKLMSVGY